MDFYARHLFTSQRGIPKPEEDYLCHLDAHLPVFLLAYSRIPTIRRASLDAVYVRSVWHGVKLAYRAIVGLPPSRKT